VTPPAPRLVGCYFAPNDLEGARWERMAAVLQLTAAQHCQAWDVSIEKIKPRRMKSARGSDANVANAQKLEHWTAAVQAAPDGTEMLLVDVDTFIVRELDSVWRIPFDLAYTVRTPGAYMYPINAGVVFLRVSDRVRRFVERWRDEDNRMLADRGYHDPFYRKYGGINQASFGKLLDDDVAQELGVELAPLPCAEWNCEDSAWHSFDPTVTRLVHVKSALRMATFAIGPNTPRTKPLVNMWRGLDRAAAVAVAHGALAAR
jgi:hypothetical protein